MDPTSALAYLAGIAVRALLLAAPAALTLLVFRRGTAALRHAVWTVVTLGMLALPVFSPLLPPLEIHVLAPRAAALPVTLIPADLGRGTLPVLPPVPASAAIINPANWPLFFAGIYALGAAIFLGRLAFGYLFTCRLVSACSCVRGIFVHDLYESTWISVPMTVGWRNPKVLLPAGWQQWDAAKLEAVLAHERTHIRRGDWLVSLLAGMNRAIFWFHPLAWWLERHLGVLAEQACDDAALLLVGSREPYAQALLDMAAAVKSGQGRLVWEAMAMAKANEVRKRIELILDETRQIPRGLNRLGWATLVACSLPLLYLAATVQLAPAQIVYSDLRAKSGFTAADAAVMEQQLALNPQDLEKRGQLVLYYFSTGQRQQRLDHITWLVANHPEATAAVITSAGVGPVTSALNDAGDYTKIANLWKQQAAARAGDPRVLGNAAQFFLRAGGNFEEAERLYNAARTLEPGNSAWANGLASVYSEALLGSTGDYLYPRRNAAFASRVQAQLENSNDSLLLVAVGSKLSTVAARPLPNLALTPGTLNLDDHPALGTAIELGARLINRARAIGAPATQFLPAPTAPRELTAGAAAPPPPAQTPVALTPVYVMQPVYPQLARQARIQGVVVLNVNVGMDGSVVEISVVSGHPLLIVAALDAVKQYRFPPQPAITLTQIRVPFTLSDAPTPPTSDTMGQNAAPAVPSRIKVGGNVQAARITNRIDPIYPAEARDAGVRGSVVLSIDIGQDGVVERIEVLEGHPLLAAAAVQAVRQWRYQPTHLNGQPVTVVTTVTVPFPPE